MIDVILEENLANLPQKPITEDHLSLLPQRDLELNFGLKAEIVFVGNYDHHRGVLGFNPILQLIVADCRFK
ncbi:MAG TPA: hypothetical protein VEV87_03720 [Chitinophagaceae bacterium]|nr:hypothetical protein [Chitinophagaceae bacterium]